MLKVFFQYRFLEVELLHWKENSLFTSLWKGCFCSKIVQITSVYEMDEGVKSLLLKKDCLSKHLFFVTSERTYILFHFSLLFLCPSWPHLFSISYDWLDWGSLSVSILISYVYWRYLVTCMSCLCSSHFFYVRLWIIFP